MKPRVITTYRILAVALTTAGGCSAKSEPPEDPAPVTDVASSPVERSPPKPTEPASLVALRTELAKQPRSGPPPDLQQFRPLCDADGYPLVGNVLRKAPRPLASRRRTSCGTMQDPAAGGQPGSVGPHAGSANATTKSPTKERRMTHAACPTRRRTPRCHLM